MVNLERKRHLNKKPAADAPVSRFAAALLVTQSHSVGVFCELCARDANYALVTRNGRTYCSVECAESVAGLYLG